MWKLSSLRSDKKVPQVPAGVRIYAIGDVHGRADLLASLLLQIEVDIALHPISKPITVFLGDYIDRGPDSKQVIDLLISPNHTPEMICLKGNHETFLLNFLKTPALLDDWRQCGGLETLVSYGLKPPMNPSFNDRTRLAHDLANATPESHRKFFQALRLSFVCGDFLFVHAGLRPLIPLQQQSEDDLLWIRDDFLLWDKPFEKIVVHGHTPVLEPDVRFNRINIDTGAFATGRLTCMTIEGAEIMPLVDVRDWLSTIEGGRRPEDSNAIAGNPDAIAAIHVKRLKEGVEAYDATARARLDPRRSPNASDLAPDQPRR